MTRPKLYGNDPVKNRIYNSYRNIRQCCYNPNNTSYQRAHRDGIELYCDWDSFESFYDWVMIKLGPPPFPLARIVRKDQTKPYTPKNLEWNTHKAQGSRLNLCHRIRWRGKTLNIKQWCEEVGVSFHTVYGRWGRGITEPKVLFSKTNLRYVNAA